ncbi:tRNA (adenosine(37)-N6)-dimethylallyltransferase MiaA [Methylocystis parvus]|uniref:tRNA dimethylallyltransferase n=1 Tax=Methylocystis parvus TaxID=134 RepID=A0A6B8MCY3_9HYPH|nr:tRNA (adenosine(37)-N6)-dimethylallyltransferase MiaA [Methylocystis parvus]QGM99173.1 tRNA (adenosine(37)-N6)-dimethylallyltransferase MiaA [Methylocystis parvus]WBK00453.1 tRNA (adenosine(37)-N6)-dimethylallyltransferase MiaA [Methylocystis parvus OBBP]
MTARAFLIAGPTASGKSALALQLAKRIGGAVVNADSMQVYRDLRIITARPTPQEEAEAPHLLFGHVDAGVNYSVGRYLADLATTLDELDAKGVTAVLTGGTGMYFKSALYGLSDIPAVPEDVRAKVRDAAQEKTPQELHAELAAKDPETAARLRPTDPQRILRALEVLAATGKPLASFQGPRSAPLLDVARCPAFFLAPERETLYARIDARFDRMMETGALEEVACLRDRGLDPALPAMRAHGVPGLVAYLDGHATLDEAIMRGKIDTRRYAKRQFTFARHQLPSFKWLSGAAIGAEAEAACCAFGR